MLAAMGSAAPAGAATILRLSRDNEIAEIPRSGERSRSIRGCRGSERRMNGHNPPMATTEDRRELGGSDEWRRKLYEAAPERQGELFSS
jgi:hypothetical protein